MPTGTRRGPPPASRPAEVQQRCRHTASGLADDRAVVCACRGDVLCVEGQDCYHRRAERVLDRPDRLVSARQADLVQHKADPLAVAIGRIAEHSSGALDALLVRTKHNQHAVGREERGAIDGWIAWRPAAT